MASVTTVDGIQVTFAPKGVLAPADHDANTGMAITCVYGVTKEALRISESATAFYGDTVNGRIGAVVFAAPDIDMDVFSSAITRIGPLAGKITVIASTNDRALALSGRIAGGMTRVGAAEKAAIERLGVRVIDASDTGWGIINHDLFLSNEEVQRVIRRSIDAAAT